MKRKLNENDVPEGVAITDAKDNSFSTLCLDARLLKTIQREQWSDPTPVQKAFIPLALQGKSILAKSGTGTGKTAAYVLPILQSILRRKNEQQSAKQTSALILVPTRELANQVTKVTEALAAYADTRVVNLTLKEDERVQRARLADSPDIVVATPGRASNNSALSLKNLQHLVIDEADLVLSYDTENDLKQIAGSGIPTGCQTFFVSATLDPALDTLKELFCKDPVTLELKEEAKDKSAIDQYVVKCGEDTKFLLIYALFMLKLVKGKAIIFVADVDRCYRLKLFLEQFGIRSCILNPELPVNSRIHVVEEFNKNVYDIIIASDDHEVVGGEGQKVKEVDEEEDEEPTAEAGSSMGKTSATVNGSAEDATEDSTRQPTENDHETEETPKSAEVSAKQPPKKKRKTPKRSKDYGVARGIDFRNVALVLNFDLPTSSKSYTHRIGRTARAGKTGMALSFVVPKTEYRKHKATSVASCENDEDILAQIVKTQEKRGLQVKDFVFDMTKLASFQYRINDALKAVTRLSIRQARVRELKSELLKSEKLKRHFEENEDELQHLRHDTESRTAVVQPHLKHVPDYLLPGGQRRNVAQDIGYVGLRGDRSKRPENRRGKKRVRMAAGDPLKTFNAKGRGKGPLKMR